MLDLEDSAMPNARIKRPAVRTASFFRNSGKVIFVFMMIF